MGDPRAHVALLVDFANLRQQLSDADAPVDGATSGTSSPPTALSSDDAAEARAVAGALVAYAGGIGRVGVARAYADWTREPQLARSLNGTRLEPVLVPATEDGEDRSHIRLAVDAMATLLNGDGPDAFVLVSGDPSLVPLVQALRADGSEVTVVAAASAQAAELSAESDHAATFQDVMAGERGDALPLRPARERSGAPAPSSAEAPRGGSKRADDRGGYYARTPILRDSDFRNYDWTGFVQLIDELEQRLPFVGVRYLVNKVLGPHNCGVEDPHIKRDLINEAVDDGLIEMYTVGNVNERTDPVTACRLDRHNEVVVEILGAAGADADDLLDREPVSDEATSYSTTSR